MAITVRNDLKQNSQLIGDLENNNNQEIIWIQINLKRRNRIYAGVYYGKQENAPADEIERDVTTKSTNYQTKTEGSHNLSR